MEAVPLMVDAGAWDLAFLKLVAEEPARVPLALSSGAAPHEMTVVVVVAQIEQYRREIDIAESQRRAIGWMQTPSLAPSQVPKVP